MAVSWYENSLLKLLAVAYHINGKMSYSSMSHASHSNTSHDIWGMKYQIQEEGEEKQPFLKARAYSSYTTNISHYEPYKG